MKCPVCLWPETRRFQVIDKQLYWRCPACHATFIDPAHLPDPETEFARYRMHRNTPDDPGYRGFLERLAGPLLKKITPGSKGLDYGCGPAGLLSEILAASGMDTRNYDPFFHPDASALQSAYDFITCAEVAEHFHHPAEEFQNLNRLLKTGGWLGIMTCFQTDDKRFANWYYRRDFTHVVFYRESTFRLLAAKHNWRCEIPAPNIVLMQKREPAG